MQEVTNLKLEDLCMKDQQKVRVPLRISLMVTFLLIISAFGFSRIKLNGSPIAFASQTLTGVLVNQYVIEGASYYLKSQSAYLDLLHRVEVFETAPGSFEGLLLVTDEAIKLMEYAIVSYTQLKQWADITPYNEDVLASLKDFNYKKFQQEKGLNPDIFWKVRVFLKDGDICGIYDKMLLDSKHILSLLNNIKADLAIDKIPGNYSLWNLNQMYLESLIFDQYVAMVFYAIM